METANFILRFLNDITSIYWWVSVVIVGLLINLAAAYLKPPLDLWLSRWSKKRTDAYSEKHTKYVQEVERLFLDPELISITGFEDLRCRLKALTAFLYGVCFAGLSIFLPILGTEYKTSLFAVILRLLAILMSLICIVLFVAEMKQVGRLTSLLDGVSEVKKN